MEDQTRARSGWGSPEHKEATRLFRKVQDEMRELESMIIAGQATTVAGLLARWEIIEWLSDLDQEPQDWEIGQKAA